MEGSSNKRGLITDVFGLVFSFFLLAVGVVIVWILISSVNDEIKDVDNDTISKSSKENYTQYADSYVNIWDNVYLITFVGLTIAGMIFLFFLQTNIIIWFLIWFVNMAILYFASALANNYARIATTDGVSDFASDFTFIPFILNHYLEIMIIITALYAVIFFVKNNNQRGIR